MQLICSYLDKKTLDFTCNEPAIRCFGGTLVCNYHGKEMTNQIKLMQRIIKTKQTGQKKPYSYPSVPDQISLKTMDQHGNVRDTIGKNVKYRY